MTEGDSQQGVAALGGAVVDSKARRHEHGEVLEHNVDAVVHGHSGAASWLCDLAVKGHSMLSATATRQIYTQNITLIAENIL